MKYKLNSGISTLNQYLITIIGIGFLGFLIYSIITKDIAGTIVCSILVIFSYLFFIRKIKRFKEIEFDEQNIYFDETKIPYEDIIDIKFGKIVFKENSNKSYVMFGFFPFSSSFSLLNDFYKNKAR